MIYCSFMSFNSVMTVSHIQFLPRFNLKVKGLCVCHDGLDFYSWITSSEVNTWSYQFLTGKCGSGAKMEENGCWKTFPLVLLLYIILYYESVGLESLSQSTKYSLYCVRVVWLRDDYQSLHCGCYFFYPDGDHTAWKCVLTFCEFLWMSLW